MTLGTYLCFSADMSEKQTKHNWEVAAKGLLKSEMIQREFDYQRLSAHMEKLGLQNVSANNLKSKINRGSFSAAFFIQALVAMGCEEINIKNLPIRKRLPIHTLAADVGRDNTQHAAATIHESPPADYQRRPGQDSDQ